MSPQPAVKRAVTRINAPVPGAQFLEDFTVYELDFSALANGTSATGNIQIQADSDFKLVKTTYMADIATAAQTDSSRVIPLCTITITDTGSGRQLTSAAVPIPNIFGTGLIPFILPVPRIFKARSNIAITVANYSAATTYNLRLSFIGTKLFQIG